MTSSMLPPTAYNTTTLASHQRAVERVLLVMREQTFEPLSLQALADIAMISPFHFDRIFRQITGIPPCQFLAALRLEAAKRLLLTTKLRVTDICFEVGYNSIGTFTSRFTQMVGLSPRRLRYLADNPTSYGMASLSSAPGNGLRKGLSEPALVGQVEPDDDFTGPVFVGLFPTRIPQSRPLACALLSQPAAYQMPQVEEGNYFIFAASIKWPQDLLDCLLPSEADIRVAISQKPVRVQNGKLLEAVNIKLRPLEVTDPPLLIALPFLLYEHNRLRWNDRDHHEEKPSSVEPFMRRWESRIDEVFQSAEAG